MVSWLVKHTSAKASNIISTNTSSASRGETAPVASGRPRVRSTWLSSQRSL